MSKVEFWFGLVYTLAGLMAAHGIYEWASTLS